jgi:hypothetical protein
VPDERIIELPQSGLQVEIVLTPLPYRLDTLTVVARRTGIFGTAVQRSDFRALGGVDVTVLGTNQRAKTASDGTFSFDNLRRGGWLIQGSRDGFATLVISAVVSRFGSGGTRACDGFCCN